MSSPFRLLRPDFPRSHNPETLFRYTKQLQIPWLAEYRILSRFYTMPLSIKNPRAEELARAVARETDETITETIIRALEERLERIRGRSAFPDVAAEIMRVSERCSGLPDLATGSEDEILGYGPDGMFDSR